MVIVNNIGYSAGAKAVIYTDAKTSNRKITTAADPADYTNSEWSVWGDNNDEPALIADDIKNVPVLSAGIETEARLAVGRSVDAFLLLNKTPDGEEELEWVSDPEVNDWLEDNDSYQNSYRNIYNMLGYGLGASQFILNGKRDKINRIKTTDIFEARLEKRDAKGIINNMFLCGDWSTAGTSFNADKMKKILLLQEGYEFDQLNSSKSGYEFAMLHRLLRNGSSYYPQPLHRSAKAWVKITRSVPAIKAAINKNQMTIKYLVTISESFFERNHIKWGSYTKEQREAAISDTYDKVGKWLSGEENSGKTWLAGKYYDKVSNQYVDDITINVIDDKMKEGKMLPDSAAADKQILFSMFFNPAIWGGNLLGDGASGGAGSGSDIREATLVLLNLLHPERVNNLKIYNLVKNFNGWRRLEKARTVFSLSGGQSVQRSVTPRLVFRYSSSILTTLDTGKSTKPVTN